MTSVEEFNCVFCQESFNNKEDLQTHFRKHGDPNFNHYQKSRNHGEGSSSKNPNEREEVGCDVCSEMFPTISKAITHKHKVHPDQDTKYFCPWCGKLFTLKHLYTKHLQANHENAQREEYRTLHCNYCEVNFFCQAALNSHNKFFHRLDDLPLVGLSRKMKLYEKVVVQIYYCSFCGEEYENVMNLHKHIEDEHGDENQSPDDVLRCPLCEAIFFHLDAYEVHLTFHSVEDMYTEKNALFEGVTDFSLESIPPTSEKVENIAAQDNFDSANSIGIETFLELAMDSEGGGEPIKHKKHKKHKKSKKAAITLDEFLSMNTDVFGEGLDIQGVEEIPTQVVSKRLKAKKPQNTPKAKLNVELQKLKKHGIVVKKNNTKNNFNTKPIKISPEALKSIKHGSNVATQNESSTKLNNQNSKQLNIIRKSNQDSSLANNEEKISESVITLGEKNTDTGTNENMELDADQANHNEINDDKNISNDQRTKETPPKSTSRPGHINYEKSVQENPDYHSDEEEKATLSPNVDKLVQNSDGNNSVHQLKEITSQSDLINKDDAVYDDKIPLPFNNDPDHKAEVSSSGDDEKQTMANKSLHTLKRLSHLLTIKSVTSPLGSPDSSKHTHPEKIQSLRNSESESCPSHNNDHVPTQDYINSDKIVNTIKNLGGNIIIKSVGQISKNKVITASDDEFEEQANSDQDIETTEVKNNSHINIGKLNTKAKTLNSEPIKNSAKANTMIKEDAKSSTVPKFDEDSKSQNNTDILKKLTDITAKPLKNKNNQVVLASKSPHLQKKIKITKQINDDNEEVFNIEDSDSDEFDNLRHISKQNKPTVVPNKSNYNKNLTTRPLHQQQTVNKSFTKVVTQSQTMHNEKHGYDSEESYNKMEFRQMQSSKSVTQTVGSEKNLAIMNVLKNLGKNITVKSRNSSPSQSVKSQDNDSQHSLIENKGDDSDMDSEPSNVKITEIDENASEDEARNINCEPNVLSPNCSENSDHVDYNDEAHEESDEDDDIESQIKCIKLKKLECQTQKPSTSPNVENINIKSVNTNKESEEELTKALVPFKPKKLGSKISTKPLKQKLDVHNEGMKNVMPVNINNQRISNQMNTVNKAVTVKTIQTETETVIEEITTTVTKRIKTVKQEMRNTSQCSSSAIVPLKIQGIRPTQVNNPYQGTKIRHMPPAGLKIRNPQAQTRPSISGQMGSPRAPNQFVSSRPRGNVARLSTPRMPAIKNNFPSTSTQANSPGAPLKISPSAVGAKRINSDDISGPFSCFKKPKESLIPGSDVSQDNVQYSSSQVNKSNFVSTTKTVKGNVVSQMKSEMSASSQQINKLSNMTGLKVVKSQAKQTIVQEKSDVKEINAPKRTLEAIEKLQKSGLLVKKPKIVNEDSDHSEHEENQPYDSADDE